MTSWELPTEIEIAGKMFKIRTDFRAILDILAAFGDEELEPQEKAYVLMDIFYKDMQEIPREYIQEGYDAAIAFIDCGMKGDDKRRPALMDWEQDAPILIPAINKVAGTEVRAKEYLHWWTFIGYYMEVGDSLFSNIVSIRSKKAKHKKLTKEEQTFYRENKKLCDIKQSTAKRSPEEAERIRALLGLK